MADRHGFGSELDRCILACVLQSTEPDGSKVAFVETGKRFGVWCVLERSGSGGFTAYRVQSPDIRIPFEAQTSLQSFG